MANGAWRWRPTWTATSTARVRRFCAPCVRDGGRWTRYNMPLRWTRWPGRWCARRRSGPSTSRSAGSSSQLYGLRRQWVTARNGWGDRCRTRSGWSPSVVADPRAALRTMIRAFERTRDILTVPGRRLVVLRPAEPLLVLADSGVALRRKGWQLLPHSPAAARDGRGLCSAVTDVSAHLHTPRALPPASGAHPQNRRQGQRRGSSLVPGRRLPAPVHALALPAAARRHPAGSPAAAADSGTHPAPARPRTGPSRDPPQASCAPSWNSSPSHPLISLRPRKG